ncbi:hypothetical protein [Neptuniibacter halophilus]|uniref:hypothetical protein n=1 Tax=Neptuniibacter halophilus TaxID=651666 RepID=UPI0025732EE7|nr:hypothetical protein [Neptuniibacter halophilus]
MIDVDVVKGVDEGYARQVQGHFSNEQECFVLGFISRDNDEPTLAVPVRKNNIGVSFSQSLAEFFYEFAEKHFECEQGDEVLLFSAKVNCSDLDETALLSGFNQRAKESISAGEGIILKRRIAVGADSAELAERVRSDIYSQHRLLKSRD